MNVREFAMFLHNEYERQAKIVGWKTQDSCQVEFDKLPEDNKRVMLAVAFTILNNFSTLGFIELERAESRLEPYKIMKPMYLKEEKTIVYREMTKKEKEGIFRVKKKEEEEKK